MGIRTWEVTLKGRSGSLQTAFLARLSANSTAFPVLASSVRIIALYKLE